MEMEGNGVYGGFWGKFYQLFGNSVGIGKYLLGQNLNSIHGTENFEPIERM
jgi:hypothetical protein